MSDNGAKPKIVLRCLPLTRPTPCYHCGKGSKHYHTVDVYKGVQLGVMCLCGRCHTRNTAKEFHKLMPKQTPISEAI